MVGYRNERYIEFGRASARLDDLANLVPSRVTAALLLASGALTGNDILQCCKDYAAGRAGTRQPQRRLARGGHGRGRWA